MRHPPDPPPGEPFGQRPLPPGFGDPFPGFRRPQAPRTNSRALALTAGGIAAAGVAVTATVLVLTAGRPDSLLDGGHLAEALGQPEAHTPPSAESGPPAGMLPLPSAPRRGPAGTPTSRQTADAIAAGFSTGDRQSVQSLVCASRPKEVPDFPPGISLTLNGEVVESGAQAEVSATARGNGGENTFTLVLRNERGRWCYLGDR